MKAHAQDDEAILEALQLKSVGRYICPVTHKIFRYPAMLDTGVIIEQKAADDIIDHGNGRCPGLRCPIGGYRADTPTMIEYREDIESLLASHPNLKKYQHEAYTQNGKCRVVPKRNKLKEKIKVQTPGKPDTDHPVEAVALAAKPQEEAPAPRPVGQTPLAPTLFPAPSAKKPEDEKELNADIAHHLQSRLDALRSQSPSAASSSPSKRG